MGHSSTQLQLQQDKAKDRDVVLKEVEQLWRLFHKTWQRNHGCLLLLLSLCISATVMWAMSKSVRMLVTECKNGSIFCVTEESKHCNVECFGEVQCIVVLC